MCPARRSKRSKARSDPLKKGSAVNEKRNYKPDQTPLAGATEEPHSKQKEDIEDRVLAEYEQNIEHGDHTEHEQPVRGEGKLLHPSYFTNCIGRLKLRVQNTLFKETGAGSGDP